MNRKKTLPAPTTDLLAGAEVFVQVVRSGSISAAARALTRPVSTISRSLAALETDLGTPLLHRSTRQQRLTEAGALWLTHAEALLAQASLGREAISDLTDGTPRGLLRVTMPVAVGERLLAPHLPAFQAAHPELGLSIDLSDHIRSLQRDGFDLAIRVGPQPDASLLATPLGKVSIRLVASPAFVAAQGRLRHPSALATVPAISVGGQPGTVDWRMWRRERPGTSETVTIPRPLHTTSPSLAAHLAVAGVGVLMTIEWVVRRELARGELVEVLPEWTCDRPGGSGVPVMAVHPHGPDVRPPPKTRAFLGLVRSIIHTDVLPATP